jgi:hypothetical protein
LAEWVGDEGDIAANCGDNKPYPFGPSCTFKGKKIPCYCCCSESDSINGKLLTKISTYLGSLDLFDRSTGLKPFLILDGHGSWFELEFLEYINKEEHKWCVNIYWSPLWDKLLASGGFNRAERMF